MKNTVLKRHISQQALTCPEKNKILNALKEQIGSKEKVIVAISGGSDSMLTAVLVYNFFLTNKYSLQNLFFVHFNHKIRKESDEEELFIKNYFKGTQVICISRSSLSVSRTNEASLRNRRYAQLAQLVKKNKASSVILGHNLSDRIESTLLNLLRGAGLKGFISMKFSEKHHLLPGTKVIRPLINTPKANITQICKKNNIPFVIDTSNADNTTSIRNRLRNQVLPQFYALSKSKASQKTFEQSMLNIYEELQKAVREDSIFPVSITNSSLDTRPASLVPRHPSRIPISDQSPNLQPISKSPSRKAKFAYQRDTPQKEISIENIISILNQLGICKNISSRFLNDLLIFLQTSHSGYKYFQKTYFFVAHSKIYIIQAPENFRMKYIKNPSTEAGDLSSAIYQRYPQPGDRYKGKTRNQYCITQKIPLFRRNFIPVLEKDGKIIKLIKQ